jgi:hypothetical protein
MTEGILTPITHRPVDIFALYVILHLALVQRDRRDVTCERAGPLHKALEAFGSLWKRGRSAWLKPALLPGLLQE